MQRGQWTPRRCTTSRCNGGVSLLAGKRHPRVVRRLRHKWGVLRWNHPFTTLLAVLGVLWTCGTFQPTTNSDYYSLDDTTIQVSSSSSCHARPWLSFPVACAQFARGRSRLRTSSGTLRDELVDTSTSSTTDSTTLRGGDVSQYQKQKYQYPSQMQPTNTLLQIFAKAGNKALGGGIPGMLAGVAQVSKVHDHHNNNIYTCIVL
jgi:hypothetical protein